MLFNVPTSLDFNRKLVVEEIQGFFYEHDPLDNFIKGVLSVIDGNLWLSRDIMTRCVL